MPDIQLASLGAGVAQTEGGAVRAFAAGTITFHVFGAPGTGAPVPLKDVEGGDETNLTGAYETDKFGRVPGWVDESYFGQQVDIWVPPADPVTVMLGFSLILSGPAYNPGDSFEVAGSSTAASTIRTARQVLNYGNDDGSAVLYGAMGDAAVLHEGFVIYPGGSWNTPRDTGGVVFPGIVYLISTNPGGGWTETNVLRYEF